MRFSLSSSLKRSSIPLLHYSNILSQFTTFLLDRDNSEKNKPRKIMDKKKIRSFVSITPLEIPSK